jgi:hypothetical protein
MIHCCQKSTAKGLLSAALSVLLAAAYALPASCEPLTVLPSDVAGKQAYVTNKDINWYTALDDARAQAKHEGKLVFWLHMLGSINGAT